MAEVARAYGVPVLSIITLNDLVESLTGGKEENVRKSE